jgi:hypothetical protein
MGEGGWYIVWDDPNMDKSAQYMNREGMLEFRADSYKEDHYPYTRRDVVDDTITEEDFQDMNDQNNRFHRYPPFHGNVYN